MSPMPETNGKLVNIDLESRGELAEGLKTFFDDVFKKFHATEIILFGSYARDDLNEGSDIDVIVIAPFKKRFLERISDLMALTDLPVEPIGYTPAEFEAMKIAGNRFIEHILANPHKVLRVGS